MKTSPSAGTLVEEPPLFNKLDYLSPVLIVKEHGVILKCTRFTVRPVVSVGPNV
jgi:hypothetical protein